MVLGTAVSKVVENSFLRSESELGSGQFFFTLSWIVLSDWDFGKCPALIGGLDGQVASLGDLSLL